MAVTVEARGIEPRGVLKANNAGLVTCIAAATSYTLHTLPTGMPTTAKIRKILATNAVGANTFLQLGYTTLAAAWVQVIPNLLLINAIDNEFAEGILPNYEWRPDTTLVTGTLGDIICRISAVPAGNVTIILEVEELKQ